MNRWDWRDWLLAVVFAVVVLFALLVLCVDDVEARPPVVMTYGDTLYVTATYPESLYQEPGLIIAEETDSTRWQIKRLGYSPPWVTVLETGNGWLPGCDSEPTYFGPIAIGPFKVRVAIRTQYYRTTVYDTITGEPSDSVLTGGWSPWSSRVVFVLLPPGDRRPRRARLEFEVRP